MPPRGGRPALQHAPGLPLHRGCRLLHHLHHPGVQVTALPGRLTQHRWSVRPSIRPSSMHPSAHPSLHPLTHRPNIHHPIIRHPIYSSPHPSIRPSITPPSHLSSHPLIQPPTHTPPSHTCTHHPSTPQASLCSVRGRKVNAPGACPQGAGIWGEGCRPVRRLGCVSRSWAHTRGSPGGGVRLASQERRHLPGGAVKQEQAGEGEEGALGVGRGHAKALG